MKKEKTVKTYQRRTKSGKMVTVKQHTAKYDAAEKAKEAAKKKGAGEEFDVRKNASQMDIDIDEFLSGVKARSKEEREKLKAEMEKQKSSEKKSVEKKTASKKSEPKAKETKSKDSKSCNASDCGFTAAEFKEWYQGTGSAADKKVAKALKAKLGHAGYKKLEDEAIDNYTSRGHLKMLKSLGEMKGEGSKADKFKKSSKKLNTQKTLNDYSDGDLDSTPKKDIKKVAKVLGLTEVEAASWAVGPNFTAYNESHMEKGEKKAKKYLGKKVFDMLDPTSSDSFMAVLDKARGKNASKGVKEKVTDAKVPKTKDSTKGEDKPFSTVKELHKATKLDRFENGASLTGKQYLEATKLLKDSGYRQVKDYLVPPKGKGPLYSVWHKKLSQAGSDDARDLYTGHDILSKSQREIMGSLGYTTFKAATKPTKKEKSEPNKVKGTSKSKVSEPKTTQKVIPEFSWVTKHPYSKEIHRAGLSLGTNNRTSDTSLGLLVSRGVPADEAKKIVRRLNSSTKAYNKRSPRKYKR